MVVDGKNLLLVGCQVGRSTLQGDEDGVRLALETDGRGALFDGFHGVLDLVQTPERAPGGDIVVVLVTELDGR